MCLDSLASNVIDLLSKNFLFSFWILQRFALSNVYTVYYLVKCRIRSLALYNNEFILDSACVGMENYRDHKNMKKLLCQLYFKIVRRRTEMTH